MTAVPSQPAVRAGEAATGERLHVEALDGLRGIAALSVMFYHAWVFNAQGWMAVDFFYCLSGFVIAMAYEGKLEAGLPFLRYVSWRLMRVYPMLFLGGVIGLLTWRTGEAIGFLSSLGPASFALSWLAHMLLIPFYGQEKAFPFNNVQWSILYELLANALHALFLPILSNRVLAGVLAVSGAVLAWRTFALGTMNWGFDLRHMDVGLARMGYSFFAGVLLWRLRGAILPRLPRVPFWILAAAIFVLASVHGLEAINPWLEPARQVGTVLLVNPLLVGLGAVCGARGTVIRALGVLSFPLYAIHLPLVYLARSTFALALSGMALKVAVFAACVPIVGAALLLGRWVDLPLNRLRRRLFE